MKNLEMKYDKPKRATMIQHLLEYQFKMVGKTFIDTMDDDRWKFNWTMTRKQKEEFKKYAVPALKKVFRCNTKKATLTFEWFEETFGLRLKG